MIMWDKVIMRKEDCKLDETIENMYVLFNEDKSIRYGRKQYVKCSGKDLKVAVHYQIQPTVGFLVDHTFEPVRTVHVPKQ